jgi:hypothetical protein
VAPPPQQPGTSEADQPGSHHHDLVAAGGPLERWLRSA